MKRLLVVRHGDTFAPGIMPRRIGARTDLPLTARGEDQARELGRWLHERGIVLAAAASGPLMRARRTGQLILAEIAPTRALVQAAWLDEIDHGPDEGRVEDEVTARVGADALAEWDRRGTPPPGWLVDRPARLAACRAGTTALPSGTTLLVTSSGAARLLLIALGVTPPERGLKMRTGATGEIVLDENGASLLSWDVRPID